MLAHTHNSFFSLVHPSSFTAASAAEKTHSLFAFVFLFTGTCYTNLQSKKALLLVCLHNICKTNIYKLGSNNMYMQVSFCYLSQCLVCINYVRLSKKPSFYCTWHTTGAKAAAGNILLVSSQVTSDIFYVETANSSLLPFAMPPSCLFGTRPFACFMCRGCWYVTLC